MSKHALVIVTFNRLSLLKECVHAALAQKRPYDEIYLIDNASTDGTGDYIRSLRGTPGLHCVRMKENGGGAGGFYAGLRLAMQGDCDWFTLIDDDAILRADFLSVICEGSQKDPACLCFAGVPLTGGLRIGHRRSVEGNRIKKEVPVPKEAYEKEFFLCDIASFCGLVVSRELAEQIGYPRKDYFLWYDDTEYCLRIDSVTKIKTLTDAVIDHKAPPAGETEPTWKDYYGIRNRLDMTRRFYGGPTLALVTAKKVLKGSWLCLRHLSAGDQEKALYALQVYSFGIGDGLSGRLGKNERFMPGVKR